MNLQTSHPEERFKSPSQIRDKLLDVDPKLLAVFKRETWALEKHAYSVNATDLVRDAEEKDFTRLAEIYKRVYFEHNIFNKPIPEIGEYLRNSNTANNERGGGYLVYDSNGEIKGGLLINIIDTDRIGKHVRIVYNHFTSTNGFADETVIPALLNAAERRVKEFLQINHLTSAKVDIYLARIEYDQRPILENGGFELEGTLKHEYRLGDHVMALGKLYVV